MVDLREVVLLPQVWVQDVVQVHGQDVQEAAGARGVDGVAGVVCVGPGVGPTSKMFCSMLTKFNIQYQ